MKKVWFITGASKGLGLTLVKKLLTNGYKVAATSRNKERLRENVQKGEEESFLPLQVDLTDETSVKKAIDETVEYFGNLDVVVNNAGYALAGALEELTHQEIQKNFEVNVHGSLRVIRHSLPHLRIQQSGHIFNISSIGGFTGQFPGFGIYSATKFAVQGFSEALAEEAAPFGIHTTIVSPGYFRTEFLSDSSLNVPKNVMKEYDNVRQTQKVHQEEIAGNQPGDPEKAADVFIKMAEHPNPPLHLLLGTDAYSVVNQKLKDLQNELEAFEKIGTSTDIQK